MDAFQKKYSATLMKVMKKVYDLDRRKNICLRKCMIKTIKTKNVQEKQQLLTSLEDNQDLNKIQRIKSEIGRDMREIEAINEYLKNHTTAMIKANEVAVENLARNALKTTTASLIKNYLDEYKNALSLEQDIRDAKEREELIAREELEREKEMDTILVEAEINAAKNIRDYGRNLKEADYLEKLIFEDLKEMDNYAPLTQRRVTQEELPLNRSSSESEFGEVRISDLFPRRFMTTDITKTDSFEFGPLKEEIEYTSTQIPSKNRDSSYEETDKPCCSTWQDDNLTVRDKKRLTKKSTSIIYIDSAESKYKMEKQTECITIDDSSDIEETECFDKKKVNTGWYERYNQELEERERRGELTPPRTTRPVSSIKITKLNKKTKEQNRCEENPLEDPLTPTQLLYPPSLEKEFIGSQSDMNFFDSCLEAEKREKRQIKPSASIEEIKKRKYLKKLSFGDIYDDEGCNNEKEKKGKMSKKFENN